MCATLLLIVAAAALSLNREEDKRPQSSRLPRGRVLCVYDLIETGLHVCDCAIDQKPPRSVSDARSSVSGGLHVREVRLAV